jgi:LPS-assembly protein
VSPSQGSHQRLSRNRRFFRYGAPLPACGLVLLLGFDATAQQTADDTATQAPWDCRMSADGRSWDCARQSVPETGQQAAPPPEPPAPARDTSAVGDPVPQPVPSQQQAPADPGTTVPRAAAATTPAALAAAEESPAPGNASTVASPDRVAQPAADTAKVEAPAPSPSAATEPTRAAEPSAADSDSPRGRAAVTAASAAFATDIDAGIDWSVCPLDGVTPAGALDQAQLRTDAPIEVTADSAVMQYEPQQAEFSGNVRLIQDSIEVETAHLLLNRATGEAEMQGGFLLKQPTLRVAGDSAHYQMQSGGVSVDNADYRLPAIRARGEAERAAFLGNGVSELTGITYSTCAPGDDSWLLTAETLELDHDEGFGTAHHASLRFGGVPVLYAPRFSFPIDDRRRSGVLVPTVGYGDNNGIDIAVPYYFNLAENYDLTLTPRVMSERGLMLSGEFRFLTESSSGTLEADLLPDDRKSDEYSTRGAFRVRTSTRFDERTTGRLNVGYVSDEDYTSDLGGNLAATSATHVQRTGTLTRAGDTWDLTGAVEYFQTIDGSIDPEDRPYSTLPRIRFDLEQPDNALGLTYHLDAEYGNFYRKRSVRGHRIDVAPAISLPLRDQAWFVEPRVGARYTAYSLTDQVSGLDDRPSNLTGVFSFDSGMYFDRTTNWFGTTSTQTLEPRLFYLLVPSSEQDDQPIFDTSDLDFTFDNLFRDNRFNGPDRMADANQATLALTSRINAADSGRELLRASIGQIMYFSDLDVTLPGEDPIEDGTSSVVGEVAALLGGGWQTRAGLQWDPHDGDNGTIDQALAQLSYRGERKQVFNAAYRLREGVARQTDLAFFWPLDRNVTVIGRHYYSLRESRLLEALAGIEYGTCCWRVRALARKYTDGSGDEHNFAVLLQLELSGLGRIGDDIDRTLERGIYGYRLDDDD